MPYECKCRGRREGRGNGAKPVILKEILPRPPFQSSYTGIIHIPVRYPFEVSRFLSLCESYVRAEVEPSSIIMTRSECPGSDAERNRQPCTRKGGWNNDAV